MRIDHFPAALLALLFAAALPACAAQPDAADSQAAAGAPVTTSTADHSEPLRALPTGTRWRLAGSEREALSLADAGGVTLRIEQDRLYGDSGCNQYSAGYQVDPSGNITVEPVVSTKRGCPGDVGTIENAWYEALGQLQSIRRAGDDLLLVLAPGDTLRFVPAPPEAM